MRHFRIRLVVLGAAALLAGCSSADSPAGVAAADPGLNAKGLVFVAPDGFEERPAQKLYYHPTLRASIKAAHQVGAEFEKVASGFTKENLLKEGMELEERTTETVDGRETLFLKTRRIKAPYPQTCVISVFPTVDGCAQFVAFYPADSTAEVAAAIRKAIVTARYNK